jgi:hypothetical protein
VTIMRLAILLAAALALAVPSSVTGGNATSEWVPPDGFVPDADTAAKVSEVILARIFGDAQTDREKPFKVNLEDGVWIVKGQLPPNLLGGVAEIHISKKDARILHLLAGM